MKEQNRTFKSADFVKINIGAENIEYLTVKDVYDTEVYEHLKDLKFGQSYFDNNTLTVYVAIIEQSELSEIV